MKIIYLYIKTHRQTGLKYFGKTTKDPFKYHGSGKRWKAHLRKHGADVETEILGAFDDIEVAKTAALKFSREHRIVHDPGWANLIEENALDGAPVGHPGHKFTDEQLKKLSAASKKNWEDPAFRERLQRSQSASWTDERRAAHQRWLEEHWTDERRKHQRMKLKGRANPLVGRPGVPKSPTHAAAIASALRGIPKVRCCRIEDKREMSVGEFTKWLNRVRPSDTSG